jgi:predicted transporter
MNGLERLLALGIWHLLNMIIFLYLRKSQMKKIDMQTNREIGINQISLFSFISMAGSGRP